MPGQLFNFSRYFKKGDQTSQPADKPNTDAGSQAGVVEDHTTITTSTTSSAGTASVQPYSGIGYPPGGGQPYSGIGYPQAAGVPAQQTTVTQETKSTVPETGNVKSTPASTGQTAGTNQPAQPAVGSAPGAQPSSNPTMQKRVGMDVLTRLTQRSNTAIMAGVTRAKQLKSPYIDTEHVLYGLLTDSAVYQIVSDLKATPKEIQDYLDKNLKPGNFTKPPQFSPRVKRVLELALSAAKSLGYEFISPEHILLALAQEGEGMAAQVMAKYGLTVEALNKKITGKKEGLEKEGQEKTKESTIESFTEDLTAKARDGRLDPVVARSAEIERIVHILSRRTKNNPVLIGDAGVGKTAIVEGLAQRIAAGDVPETLLNKRILQLDLMSLIAGAGHRGEFEERLKNLIKEIKASAGQIILFIDEIHNMVGAGSGSEGTMDASNILKPSLARGELQTIGTTTVTEYRKYIEKDPALERRFQPVLVPEPTADQAIEMLRAIRDRYEAFHKVSIPDDAIEAAVRLSQRYVGDRFLPDKAVDLIDEAASAVRLPAISLPEEIKSIQDRLTRLDSEKKEADKIGDTVRLATITREIEELESDLKEKKQAYEIKKSTTTNVVTPIIIQEIVSRWTNIPISKLTESETSKLLSLEDTLHKRLIDQSHAVAAVAEAVRRGRAGLKNTKRPIGSFIFMGPTGVGKTELAKTLAETLFGSEEMMVRLDMSEYMEKHEVAKLIGAPPGYVGYEEGGQLTEAVRRHPYAVVLFDEIEKAHPDVFNILIQLLDDGRLTDNKGHTISFKNTIVICTSNIGTGIIQEELVQAGKLTFAARAFATYAISPTGREMITLGDRMWTKEEQRTPARNALPEAAAPLQAGSQSDAGGKSKEQKLDDKAKNEEEKKTTSNSQAQWVTSKLVDYFSGTKVTNEAEVGEEGKLPDAGIDTQVIAPSGEEMVTHGDRFWARKSTTAKEWLTDTLIAFFKDHIVVNAMPDQPDEQLPTARVDTMAIAPNELQVITFGNRFWQRQNLTTKDWMSGTLADYGKEMVVVGEKLKVKSEKLKIEGKTQNENRDKGESEISAGESLEQAQNIVRDPVLQLPTKNWDVHLFTPTGEEIIVYGDRFWKRASAATNQWTTDSLVNLFKEATVVNADPKHEDELLPVGQALVKAKKAKEIEEDERFAQMADKLLEELRKFFRPELLNRFDEIIVFRTLTADHMLAIVDLQMKGLTKLLEEQSIGFEATDAARQELASLGYDPIYGARPLRRTIQREVENSISSLLISGKVKAGDTIRLDFDGNQFTFDVLAMGSLKKTEASKEETQTIQKEFTCGTCGTTFTTEVVPQSTTICPKCATVIVDQPVVSPPGKESQTVPAQSPAAPEVQSPKPVAAPEMPSVVPLSSPTPPSLATYFGEQGSIPAENQTSQSSATSSPVSPAVH